VRPAEEGRTTTGTLDRVSSVDVHGGLPAWPYGPGRKVGGPPQIAPLGLTFMKVREDIWYIAMMESRLIPICEVETG
jgi:hypothetical protein